MTGVMTGVEGGDVGIGERFAFRAELALDPGRHGLPVAIEHPESETERPHVLAAERVCGTERVRLHRVEGKTRNVQGDHFESRER